MSDTIREQVRNQYGAVATRGLSSESDGVRAVAEAFGYSADELASIPAEANMGLSCGNPLATARLREGEVVVDLGCGGGLDVLLAAPKVGPSGKAIGIDMTQQMIDLARRNAANGPDGKPVENVEFHLATIDNLPLEDASVDCVISNCVINLAPDKPAVLREVFRVLKPGGRLAVSDIALKKPLPEELADSIAAYVGCIAGAIAIETYSSALAEAGFDAVEVVDTGADLNAYAQAENAACCNPAPAAPEEGLLPIADDAGGCCGPAPAAEGDGLLPVVHADGASCSVPTPSEDVHAQLADLIRRFDINDFAASVKVFAVKAG